MSRQVNKLNPTLPRLKSQISQTVHDLATGFISRYMPDFFVPPTLAGFPTNSVDAIQLDFAQCETLFSVAIHGDITLRQSLMPVEGIFDWRTPFGTIKILHQFSFLPKKHISLTYSLLLSKA